MSGQVLLLAVVILILILIVAGGLLAYSLIGGSAPSVKHPGKYNNYLLDVLDVYTDWDYADTRTPNYFEIQPGGVMHVGYWDVGYRIGMSSYFGKYTVLSPTSIRIDYTGSETVLNHTPPKSVILTYVDDNHLSIDDGTGARALQH